MLSTFRNRLGAVGVLVVAALAFAMLGGAYALAGPDGGADASKRAKKKKGNPPLSGKQKREVRNIAKSFQGRGPQGPAGTNGQDGAAGPAGPVGPQGPKGATGATGEDGATGTTGEDGATGFSGFTATLPPGETETGAWGGIVDNELEVLIDSVSFPIPLASPIPGANVKAIKKGEAIPAECDDGEGEAASAGNPEADPGWFCVFQAPFAPSPTPETFAVANPAGTGAGTGKTGAKIVAFEGLAVTSEVFGTFAVTACGNAEFPCP